MGIIQRQSIKKSIVNYLGVGIGALSVLFVYPRAEAIYGLLLFLIATANLILPFASMGINVLVVRFFPEFKNKESGHNGYLALLLVSVLVGFLVVAGLLWLFQEPLLQMYADKKDPAYLQFIPYAIPLTLLLIYINLFVQYTANFHRVVVPAIVHELFLKIAQPTLILLFLGQFLHQAGVVNSFLLIHVVILLALVIYLKSLGELTIQFNFSFLQPDLLKRMAAYAGFGILGGLGSILAFRIDTFMVGTLLDFALTGLYGIVFFIANSIEVPQRAMLSITAPIVSQKMKEKDYEAVNELYQKVSLNLLLVAVLLFLLIWFNFDDLFALIPNGERIRAIKIVALILMSGKLIDMATSINGFIIGFSSKYWFNLVAVLLLGVLNISLNILLIPKYQLVGVAIATASSIAIYNIIKLVYVYYRFKMQPFTWNTLKVLALAASIILVMLVLPSSDYLLLNLVVRSILLTGFYFGVVYYFQLSPDLIDLLKGFLERLKKIGK